MGIHGYLRILVNPWRSKKWIPVRILGGGRGQVFVHSHPPPLPWPLTSLPGILEGADFINWQSNLNHFACFHKMNLLVKNNVT